MFLCCSLLSADGVSGVSLDLDFCGIRIYHFFYKNSTFTKFFYLLMWWLWLRTASLLILWRFLVTVTIPTYVCTYMDTENH
ncbi:hypothetical protein BZA77DRAFT_6793 [Pyronema omphalodes]|nr:hypothetical protein BZA77DRAFT_6793 [Pyronema omphalodes]